MRDFRTQQLTPRPFALATIAGARADQYNYDLCGVVEEKRDPTSRLFQTILNA
jgi:hypothetical protein